MGDAALALGRPRVKRLMRAAALRRLAVLTAPALLLACRAEAPPEPSPTATTATATPAPAAPAPPSPAATPGLALEGEGLRLFDPATGSARPLAFGIPWPQALAALAFRGAPETGRNEECEAGPLDYARWPDSLTLYGQDGKFAGWFADRGGAGTLATASGVGPGTTRQDLEAAYETEVFESTLGTEFAAGELYGLLDSPHLDSPITALWAGTSCNFR